MKKILSILVLAIAAVQFAFAGDIITKDAMKLPLPARNFINRHFSNPQISHIKIENEILQTKKYDVLLTNAGAVDSVCSRLFNLSNTLLCYLLRSVTYC